MLFQKLHIRSVRSTGIAFQENGTAQKKGAFYNA